jgi:hypothetical protein
MPGHVRFQMSHRHCSKWTVDECAPVRCRLTCVCVSMCVGACTFAERTHLPYVTLIRGGFDERREAVRTHVSPGRLGRVLAENVSTQGHVTSCTHILMHHDASAQTRRIITIGARVWTTVGVYIHMFRIRPFRTQRLLAHNTHPFTSTLPVVANAIATTHGRGAIVGNNFLAECPRVRTQAHDRQVRSTLVRAFKVHIPS